HPAPDTVMVSPGEPVLGSRVMLGAEERALRVNRAGAWGPDSGGQIWQARRGSRPGPSSRSGTTKLVLSVSSSAGVALATGAGAVGDVHVGGVVRHEGW